MTENGSVFDAAGFVDRRVAHDTITRFDGPKQPVDPFELNGGDLGEVIPTDGSPAFRAEIAERYDLDRDEIVLTCGTQEANVTARLESVDHSVAVTLTSQSLAILPGWMARSPRVRPTVQLEDPR